MERQLRYERRSERLFCRNRFEICSLGSDDDGQTDEYLEIVLFVTDLPYGSGSLQQGIRARERRTLYSRNNSSREEGL